MVEDLTIDTNVFLHSVDIRQEHRPACQELLNKLLSGNAQLCIDEGFDIVESRNRSKIGSEYHQHLRFVHPAFAIIVALGTRGRIAQCATEVPQATKRLLIKLISNKTDRVFVKVAYNSRSRVLVSHDFEDFQINKRHVIMQKCQVDIVTAAHICMLLDA